MYTAFYKHKTKKPRRIKSRRGLIFYLLNAVSKHNKANFKCVIIIIGAVFHTIFTKKQARKTVPA